MKKSHSGNIFTPDPNDPLYSFIVASGNILANKSLDWLDRNIAAWWGLDGVPPEKQIKLNRDIEDLRKAEKINKLLDIKRQKNELDIEEKKQRIERARAQQSKIILPTAAQMISGALEVTANANGLFSPPELSEGYTLWLNSLSGGGKVVLVLGRRGSGKTALAAKLAEYMAAKFGIPVYWLGLPEQARSLLPSWVHLVNSPQQCPLSCLIVVDEAGLRFASLDFASDSNRLVRDLTMVCRQRGSSLIAAVQSTRDTEYSLVRQADSIIFREPGLNQPESERPDIRKKARIAAAAFKGMSQSEKRESAYVFDDDFTGIIRSSLPSFWSDELSHVYAHYDLSKMQQQAADRNQLQVVITQQKKELDSDILDNEIMRLRRQGYGYERIAKTLGCSTWRVRKALANLGDDDQSGS
jgi:hypothetical protein